VSNLQDSQKNKIMNLLGLAYRANKIVTIEKEVLKAIKTKKAKLVLVACDASPKTKDRFDKKCFFHKIPLYFHLQSDEIAHALGKSLSKIVAITEDGFKEIAEKIFMEVK